MLIGAGLDLEGSSRRKVSGKLHVGRAWARRGHFVSLIGLPLFHIYFYFHFDEEKSFSSERMRKISIHIICDVPFMKISMRYVEEPVWECRKPLSFSYDFKLLGEVKFDERGRVGCGGWYEKTFHQHWAIVFKVNLESQTSFIALLFDFTE
jgi:hypothetical protein